MLGAIQPRAIRPNRVEQQRTLGAILHWVRYYSNWVARLVRRLIPALVDHDADARSLDIPCSDGGGVLRARADRDDDVAVRVLQPILVHDADIREILRDIEHRAGMMGKGRAGCEEQDPRERHRTQNCSFRLHLTSVTVPYFAANCHRNCH